MSEDYSEGSNEHIDVVWPDDPISQRSVPLEAVEYALCCDIHGRPMTGIYEFDNFPLETPDEEGDDFIDEEIEGRLYGLLGGDTLTNFQRLAVYLNYWWTEEPKTKTAIGRAMGVSRQMSDKHYAAALKKLKKSIFPPASS